MSVERSAGLGHLKEEKTAMESIAKVFFLKTVIAKSDEKTIVEITEGDK